MKTKALWLVPLAAIGIFLASGGSAPAQDVGYCPPTVCPPFTPTVPYDYPPPPRPQASYVAPEVSYSPPREEYRSVPGMAPDVAYIPVEEEESSH